jgi:hypothetical protein
VIKRTSSAALVLISVLCASPVINAQSTDPIPEIRRQYTSINRNIAKYQKVKKELAGFSAEGGELVAWFKGPSIMKIAATFYGESGRATEEYYYSNDKLIFVFRKDSRYSQPLSGKVVSTTENRFYFKNDKLIRWIDGNGKQVGLDAPEYHDKQVEYLKNSKEFSDGARSKNRTIESGP